MLSITAPEEIAKKYGGNKRKIQQAAAQGLIDPTSAVLAGMFVDRMRGAAQQEQAQQTSTSQLDNCFPELHHHSWARPQGSTLQNCNNRCIV